MLLLLPRLSRCSQSSCSLTSLGLNRARPAPPYRHSSKTSSSSSAFKTSFLSLHSSSVHRQKGLLLFSSSPISLISVKSSSAWSLSLKRNQVSPAKAIMAPVEGTGVKAKVQELIKSHTVMVFSKTTCPFCDQIKELFKERQIQAQFLELDTLGEEGTAIQEALLEISGQKTVPNVFINGKHLGKILIATYISVCGQVFESLRERVNYLVSKVFGHANVNSVTWRVSALQGIVINNTTENVLHKYSVVKVELGPVS